MKFKGMLKKTLSAFKRVVKAPKALAAVVCAAVIVCVATVTAVYLTQRQTVYKVCYNDVALGCVSNLNEAQSVVTALQSEVVGEIRTDIFNFEEIKVIDQDLTGVETLVNKIKTSGDGIVSVSGVLIDGVMVAVTDNVSQAEAALEALKKVYITDSARFVGFDKEVTFNSVYVTEKYLAENRIDLDKLSSGGYGIGVITKKTETYEESISYKSVKQYRDDKKTTYSKVLQSGKKGLKEITVDITYINGVEAETEEIQSVVITQPIDKITEVGTIKEVSEDLSSKYSGTDNKSVQLEVPSYKQSDERWGSVKLGSSGKTIAKIGCVTTSFAMTESYRTSTVIYPDAMSKKLSYTSSGNVYWPKSYNIVTSKSNYLAVIYSKLLEGKPVIFGSKNSSGGQHWVVITGFKGGSLTASNFVINDPASNSKTTLQQHLNSHPRFYKFLYY